AIADSFAPGGSGRGVAATADTTSEAQLTHTHPFVPAASPNSGGDGGDGGNGGSCCFLTEASWPDYGNGEKYGVNMSVACSTLPPSFNYGGIAALVGLGGAGGAVPMAAMGSLEPSSFPPFLFKPSEESIAAAEAWLAQQEGLLAEMERYNRTDPESIGLTGDASGGGGATLLPHDAAAAQQAHWDAMAAAAAAAAACDPGLLQRGLPGAQSGEAIPCHATDCRAHQEGLARYAAGQQQPLLQPPQESPHPCQPAQYTGQPYYQDPPVL
ncbi:hypothetical protein Vretimale_13682, partial [Volvox reticuliferus]